VDGRLAHVYPPRAGAMKEPVRILPVTHVER
jgi:hypothetical protein